MSLTRSLPVFALLGAVASASAAVYNVQSDFSLASNPNGAWSYGSRSLADGAASTVLNLFTQQYTSDGYQLWVGDTTPTDPNAGLSRADGTFFGIPPGAYRMHPGFVGSGEELAVTRLTLGAGKYFFSGNFYTGDSGTVDTYVVVNGVIVDQGAKDNAFGGLLNLTGAVNTIEFVVGPGANYFSDSTGLNAVVTSAPAPSALASFGLAALGSLRRRRRAR